MRFDLNHPLDMVSLVLLDFQRLKPVVEDSQVSFFFLKNANKLGFGLIVARVISDLTNVNTLVFLGGPMYRQPL